MKPFLQGVLGGVIVLLLAAILFPAYSDYSQRQLSLEALVAMSAYQKEVEKSLVSNAPIESITTKEVGGAVKYLKVQRDGTVIAKTTGKGQVLVLIPSLENGKITWQCIGGQSKDVPRHCSGT